MKLVSKISLSVITVSILFLGCSEYQTQQSTKVEPQKAKLISEESLGLRKVDLYSENTATPDKTNYSKNYAGSGNKIERAFQDAPPMIPHDTEGMLPITINNNQCTGCHMPEVAESMGATPIPVSHFTDFRPNTSLAEDGRISKNGKAVDNTSSDKMANISIKQLSNLSGARFNCSQCHAPQSDGQLVDNDFKPDFTDPNGAHKSNWKGSSLTEGLDTLVN